MRKYMKLFSALILSSVLLLGVSSCSDDDGYSLGDFWESIVTVNEIGNGTYDFTLDNGKKLWVAAPAGLNLKPKYDRAIINYTILSDKVEGYDHYIRLNGFYDVLTKGAIYIASDDQVKQDSIGNNPIKVHSMWEGGGYLNVYFGYNAGGKDSHMLNLVSAKSDLGINDEVVKLEFRHNIRGDYENYPVRGYVSFNLAPYKAEGKEKAVFEISWKDFGGETKTKTIEYKFGTETTQPDEGFIENTDTNLNIY
ncbi:NigD-like protein [Dysgonomonas sp. BGC7]|uniref:NigD-like protein n=1 Tax=Dysgonomonas sp. BGC7 TaxID=1658008 RepID=UPI00068050B7|nr:NigD-like protein [Dysgonomonas sp. BGC7]MBD8389712.1 NigD-like N-terminal domain-containing protein [Dysgonomonas sp. BGC7]